ncbi:hypothetical protein J7E79_07050 [Bacillus sp. ISL-40]|uniref:hypothetical protein n=1 Tax=unclassified Bacillus (in: firmicutes) TaxID=185979 RepID=UPI001BEB0DCE|nr:MULTISPECIES: hypothetical protein [unclassified Bacillus (in: firmicutes)]MBT2697168.1 hypothetical protein [Bacillus sp. ISL-40]MBT2723927.1 hypothetical protein [Bacillus sp. ISL-46]MBT2744015.1 hypothetical protein [Bacillus sp. ISL-77]
MIKKALMLFLFSSVLLTACSESKLMNFIGESENWQVNYEVNLLDKDSESTNLTIKYIGGKPIPKRIKYVVESVSGKSEGEDSLNNGVLKIGGHSCSGCAVTQENEEMKATITWNDKSDTLILKNH